MTTKTLNYKALSEELDDILSKLQSSDLDVDKTVKAYERGMEIAKLLEEYLRQAENKVTKIRADWEGKAKGA